MERTEHTESEYDSFYALLEYGDVEVKKQANPNAGKFQIGHYLSLMEPVEELDRLNFYDDFFGHDEIDPEAGFDRHTVVHNRQCNLTSDTEASLHQFMG